jgi:Prenyltransferase and squalene oxidase repeat
MPPPARRVRARLVPVIAAATLIAGSGPAALLAAPPAIASDGPAATAGAAGPDLARGSAYLVRPANLIDGHYAESFPGYADYGLTLDTAFALAATGDQDSALKGIVTFLDHNGKDPSGSTVSDWTGVGTKYASGGSIGKEALLAEIVGDNPRDFSGHDLIAALNASVCARHTGGSGARCVAAGSYAYASSVFDQALGIMAQLRAGEASQAAAPVAYLESLQNSDGSFPSLIPSTGDQDVDSTAMAAMALALVPGTTAAADVGSAAAWLAGRQEKAGGFPGVGGDSINSAGLAIQALSLQAARYRAQIGAAETFLAREQNADGGFNIDAGGRPDSDVRATAQAISGAVGISFAALHRNLSGTSPPPPPRTRHPRPDPKQSARPPAREHSADARSAATVPPDPAPSDLAATGPAATGPAAAVPATAAPSHTPSAAPTVGSRDGSRPGPAPSAAGHRALADLGHDSSIAADLWWAVVVVALVAAVVIALLLARRRRLYPSSGGAR